MFRAASALALLILTACAENPKFPAPYCGLICPDLMPTNQRCEWENCKGPVQTQALWSAPFIPVPEHPHPVGDRNGPVRV